VTSSSSATSATSTSTASSPVEILHFLASNGTINAALKGLDATKAADLQGQASLSFDAISYGVNLLDVSDKYDAKDVKANAYLANGNGYFDLESQGAAQLAIHWMSDIVTIINNLPKGNTTSGAERLAGPSYADSTSQSFTPVKFGYKNLLSDDEFPLWSSKNTESYTNYLSEASSFILANNDVFSFSYDASGNGVMAVSFTKASLKSLLAEIVADSEDSSASSSAATSSASSIDLNYYNQIIDTLTLTQLSGKVTFSDQAILSASWSIDVALPQNNVVAGQASIKMSGEAAFSYGSDVTLSLPSDLSSYNMLG
jgi:hypothetical protein